MAKLDLKAFVEETHRALKEEYGSFAGVAAFGPWLRMQTAHAFLKNHVRFAGEGRWRAMCGESPRRPDLELWPEGECERHLLKMRIVWNDATFRRTITKGVARDVAMLLAVRAAGKLLALYPVLYAGPAHRAYGFYAFDAALKRLRSRDETIDDFIDRLCREIVDSCREQGVDMTEPEGARWRSEAWCGTVLVGKIREKGEGCDKPR